MTYRFPAQPPADVLAFLRGKQLRPGFDWRDVWREEHAVAFTVAKAMQLDVLTAIRDALDKALTDGQTYRQFAGELTPILQKLGWWGRRNVLDPLTGERVLAQLGSPRRLRTIYNANLRTARSAGQWERAERTRQTHPYLLYQLGPSREHREEHRQWHGLLLPVDHSWWQSHLPPNGWGCKCHVRQVSQAEAERLMRDGIPGPDREQILDPETGLPTGHVRAERIPVRTEPPDLPNREWVNRRTGEVEQVPAGIDPGWDTNPGAVRLLQLDRQLREKALRAGRFEDAVAVQQSEIRQAQYQAWVDEVLDDGLKRGRVHPVGLIGPAETAFLSERDLSPATGVIGLEDRLLAGKKARRHQAKGDGLTREEWLELPQGIAEPEATLLDVRHGTLIYVYPSRDDRKVKVVVEMNVGRKGGVHADLVATTFKVHGVDVLGHIKGGQYLLISGEIR